MIKTAVRDRHLGMLNNKLEAVTPMAELIRAARAGIRRQKTRGINQA